MPKQKANNKTKKNKIMRKCPEQQAKNFEVGTVKVGLDGNKWIVMEIKNGVRRWFAQNENPKTKAKVTKKAPKTSGEYLTHDNGGTPYKVVVYGNKKVEVFTFADDDEEENKVFSEKVETFDKLKKVFVGPAENKEDLGNSVLLSINDNEYVFIGHQIVKFKTEDKITEFYSPVANNDIPWPIAVGQNKVYLLSEYMYADKSDFKDFPAKKEWIKDALDHYNDGEIDSKMLNVETLHEPY